MEPRRADEVSINTRCMVTQLDRHFSFSRAMAPDTTALISIAPLLKQFDARVSTAKPSADEIALALSHIFTNKLSPVQTAALLTFLHATGRDREGDVIAKCAERMREAAAQVEKKALKQIVRERGRKEGSYRGGLVGRDTFARIDGH